MELYCQVLMLLHKEYHDAKYAHSDIHANHQTTKLCHTNQQQKGGDKRSLVDTYIKKKIQPISVLLVSNHVHDNCNKKGKCI